MSINSIDLIETTDQRHGKTLGVKKGSLAQVAASSSIHGKGINASTIAKAQRFAETPIPDYLQDRQIEQTGSPRLGRRCASIELANDRSQQHLESSYEVIQDNYISKGRKSVEPTE